MGATKYPHDPRCPAYGVPLWSEVDECGPCGYLSGDEHSPATNDTITSWNEVGQ